MQLAEELIRPERNTLVVSFVDLEQFNQQLSTTIQEEFYRYGVLIFFTLNRHGACESSSSWTASVHLWGRSQLSQKPFDRASGHFSWTNLGLCGAEYFSHVNVENLCFQCSFPKFSEDHLLCIRHSVLLLCCSSDPFPCPWE